MTDAIATLNAHFDAMEAHLQACIERLQSGRDARAARQRRERRRQQQGAPTVVVKSHPVPAPERPQIPVSEWERARETHFRKVG